MIEKAYISTINLWALTRDFISIVRLKPFDTSTLEGRANERHRRMVLTGLTSITAKGVSLLTAFVSVPLTLGYLGTERYGLWMTISSVIALLGFADLGLGNGILNATSEADGKNDRVAASRYVSSGFFMLSGVAILVTTVLALSYPFVSWPRIFNVTTDLAARESGPAMAVFILCFAFSIPLGIVQRVQLGYQEGYISNLWQSFGSLLGLGAVLLAIYFKAGLPWLVLGMAGIPVIVTGINWIIEFCHTRPWLFPRWVHFEWNAGRKIIGIGVIFLILQVFFLIGGETIDNLVIAHTVNLSAVSTYSVTQKLFSIALLIQLFLLPLWPAFGEALARDDLTWVKKTYYRSIILSLLAGAIVSIPLVLFGRTIIRVWAGPSVVPTLSLLVSSAFLVLMILHRSCISILFNSGPFLHRQVGFFVGASTVSLLLKIVFCNLWQEPGVVWGGIVGYGIFYIIPMTIIAREVLGFKNRRI
jgi:O-antigen/teichoic acid export membrane protein